MNGYLRMIWLGTVVILLLFAGPGRAAIYYVSPVGSDAAAGTSRQAPWRTLARAASALGPGDTLNVLSGLYREALTLPRSGTAQAPITIRGYGPGTPVVRGSDVVTGWVRDHGAVWKKTGWAVNSQQVFVDYDRHPPALGRYSAQVLEQYGRPVVAAGQFYPRGTISAQMTPGSFGDDATAKALYVWIADGSDPNRHKVEVSVRPHLLTGGNWTNVSGLRFEHSNSSGVMPPNGDQGQANAVVLGQHCRFSGCIVQWADFGAVSVGGDSHIEGCLLTSSGDVGVQVSGWKGITVDHCRITHNLYRPFASGWHGGGVKWIPDVSGAIRGCEIAYNRGSGIWLDFDRSGQPLVLTDNFIHDNVGGRFDGAIKLEGTLNVLVSDNLIVHNASNGLYLLGSSRARILNNTFADNGTPDMAGITAAVMVAEDASRSIRSQGVTFVNNLLTGNREPQDLALQSTAGVTSDHNDFFRQGGPPVLARGSNYEGIRQTFSRLDDWCGTTGQDGDSLDADPRLAGGGGASAFRPRRGSPLTGRGQAAPDVPADYAGRPRPAAPAIGAQEPSATPGPSASPGGPSSRAIGGVSSCPCSARTRPAVRTTRSRWPRLWTQPCG